MKRLCLLLALMLLLCASAAAAGRQTMTVVSPGLFRTSETPPSEEPATPADLPEAPSAREEPATPGDLPDAPSAPEEPDGPARGGELLRLHQISIGMGGAYLLTVGDLVILVDCGSNTTAPISMGYHNYPLLEYLEGSGIDHVDVHIVTHWHNDHCYNVNILGALYGTEDTVVYGPTGELYKDLTPLAAGTYRRLCDGDRLTVGPLEILCVGPEYKDFLPGNRNIDSLNFIVTYGDVRIFFTGDYMQSSLLKRWPDEITDIDILSFPHHAMETHEIPRNVYKAVNPRLVLVSSVERGAARQFAIHKAGVRQEAVYLCEQEGNLLVTTDGVDIWYAVNVQPGTFPLGELLPPRDP